MDKAAMVAALIFVGFPLVLFTLLISWVLDDDRTDKRKLHNTDCSNLLHNRNTDSNNSSVGNVCRKVDSRCDLDMDTEEMKETLYNLMIGACKKERQVLTVMINLIERIENL